MVEGLQVDPVIKMSLDRVLGMLGSGSGLGLGSGPGLHVEESDWGRGSEWGQDSGGSGRGSLGGSSLGGSSLGGAGGTPIAAAAEGVGLSSGRESERLPYPPCDSAFDKEG